MNHRERILCLLSGGVPDQVPWFGDLAYYANALQDRGEQPADWQRTKAYYQYHRQLGMGFYLQGYWAFDPVYDAGIEIATVSQGGVSRQTVTTPVGTIWGETTYLPQTYSSAVTRHMVNDLDDLAVLAYWFEHTHYRPAPEEALRRRPWVQDLGLVLLYVPRTPFMELTVNYAGISNVVELWMQDKAAFEQVLEVMHRAGNEAADAALEVPADAFMIPENLSSEVVGRFYGQYVQPVERDWIARIRAKGRYSFIHMDGTLKGLIPQVGRTGYDVIEAVTPVPAGDVAIEDLRELAGPGPILWGGVPGGMFSPVESDESFERHVRHVLEVMVADKRMVLGVADQVPPDALPRRIARVIELVEQYGRY